MNNTSSDDTVMKYRDKLIAAVSASRLLKSDEEITMGGAAAWAGLAMALPKF